MEMLGVDNMVKYNFKKAVPVWEKAKENLINYNLIFRTIVPKRDNTVIAISASNMYQMFVNGIMVAEGPARAGHGYYRVDEIDISPYLTTDENIIAIYVDGYNVKNYYLIKQPAFLCAEVVVDNVVIAATGDCGFEAKYHSDRIRKIVRFSGQRTFAEGYCYGVDYKDFETLVDCGFTPVKLSYTGDKKFIQRDVPYPSYNICYAKSVISKGTVKFVDEPIDPNRNKFVIVDECDYNIRGFNTAEIELINTDEVDKGIYTITDTTESLPDNVFIDADSYAIYKLPCEKTGFININLNVEDDTEFIACFDEILIDDDVTTKRMESVQNSVVWFLKPGTYTLITNEPYSFKYLKAINRSNSRINISEISVVEFAFDIDVPKLNSGNENLDKIYNAAIETFKQNTVDIYMDCPSRERAGWLCDSFFTARVEKELTGCSVVEKNYLENFLMAEGFNDIDSKMFPMCYPADFRTGIFIPNWAMWYVLELDEYLKRTGDTELINKAKDKLYGLLEYFESYENSDGLLEKLDKKVFVEWSKANDFVQDVNYPSNMLYARMLRVMGKLYDEKFIKKAEKIEKVIAEQSYFDGFFHDHAIRMEDGTLRVVEEDVTEVCQYYAFYMNIAIKEKYPQLWNVLLNDFDADRIEKGLRKDVYPANSFMGYQLRLDLLAKENEKDIVLKDIEGFFLEMAEKTGTLWEHNKPKASCNHGFASHVIIWLNKFLKN